MPESERRQEIDHIGEGASHIVQPRGGELASGLRLGLKHLGPHVRLGQLPE
jgi:hypothetical protein